MSRILVTGSRTWTDRHTVEVAIREAALQLLKAGDDVTIVQGGADGADACAFVSAKAMGLPVVAVTSLAHTRATESRHPSGRKLADIAVLDERIRALAPDAARLLASDGVDVALLVPV